MVWGQEWKGALQLGLGEEYATGWNDYIIALKAGHIQLSDREDELVWTHNIHGIYMPKASYIQIYIDIPHREPSWWWKGIWEIKCPLKSRLFLWCLIKNKVPTWDRMKHIGLEGPGWCPLCKAIEESSIHLFLCCPFVHHTRFECPRSLRQDCIWQGQNNEEAWRQCLHDPKNLK